MDEEQLLYDSVSEHPFEQIDVLLVDDDSDLLETTALFLERQNESMTVVQETEAEDALEQLLDGSSRFDCVVSDYEMPGMDGIDFLRAVREEYSDLPFVLYTGRGAEAIASRAISAGATDYLQKQPGTAQYELLANRIENAVCQYWMTEKIARLTSSRS